MAKVRNYKDIKALFDSSGDGCTLQFITGEAKIPNGFGRWAVSCGCGSGKSTNILSIIKQRYSEGITICVPTIKEANELIDKMLKQGISKDIIISLNSTEKDTMTRYKENPSFIEEYKVIIITHPRMWMDPLSHFTNKKKWFLIDELNLHIKPMTLLQKDALMAFFYINEDKGSDGIHIDILPGKYLHLNDKDVFGFIYDNFLRQSNSSFNSKRDALTVEKRDYTYEMGKKYIIDYFTNKMASSFDGKSYPQDLPIYSSISDS